MTAPVDALTGWSVEYVTSLDGARIAYAVMGDGPTTLVVTPVLPAGHLQLELEMPGRQRWYETMASRYRVVRYDPRGAGLSTRDVDDFRHESHVADLEAVVRRVAKGPLAILARHHGGGVAMRLAATRPDLISRLILWHSFARAADYVSVPRTEAILSLVSKDWELFTETVATFTLASREHEEDRRYAAYVRQSIDPRAYERSLSDLNRVDCTGLLPLIACPTLILHRRDVWKFDVGVSESLASVIPDARLATVSGTSWALFGEDTENITNIIQSFLSEGEGASEECVNSCDVTFTDREEEILRLLAAGLHNRNIAESLCLSVHTIERHVANIYLKMGVHSRVEAALYAYRHGMA